MVHVLMLMIPMNSPLHSFGLGEYRRRHGVLPPQCTCFAVGSKHWIPRSWRPQIQNPITCQGYGDNLGGTEKPNGNNYPKAGTLRP